MLFISFVCPNNIPFYSCTVFCISVYQLMDICFASPFSCCEYCTYEHSCSSFCVNICLQFSCVYTRSGMTAVCGKPMFNFLRNFQTVLQSKYSVLHLRQQSRRIFISPHPYQHLIFFVFLIIPILMGIKWYFIMVLILISLMTKPLLKQRFDPP